MLAEHLAIPSKAIIFLQALFCMGFPHPHVFVCAKMLQSCLTLCDPTDCSKPGLLVPHHLPKFAQVHGHCIDDAIQSSHPLMPSSPSALNLSQHQGLFQRVGHSHSVQFTSVAQSCPTLCNPVNLSTPGLPVHHQLLEYTQTHVH